MTTDKLFRNIQVLKGMPIDTFFDAMGMFAASMGDDCTYCHSKDAVFRHEAFGDPTPRIQKARQMIVMMQALNKQVLRRPAARDLLHLPPGQLFAGECAAPVAAVRRSRTMTRMSWISRPTTG